MFPFSAVLPSSELLKALLVVWVVRVVVGEFPGCGGKGSRGGWLELSNLKAAHWSHAAGLCGESGSPRDAGENGGRHGVGGVERWWSLQ